MGEAIVGDVGLALEWLVEAVPTADRAAPEARPEPGRPPRGRAAQRLEAMAALADAWPADGIAVRRDAVVHARAAQPAADLAARQLLLLRQRRPRLRHLGRRRGAAGLSRTGRSSACSERVRPNTGSPPCGRAVAYKVPVTFLVLRNEEYMILKWFAMLEQVTGAPGLDLPGLDVAAVARAYGMPAREVSEPRGADGGAARGDRRRGRSAAGPGAGRLRDVARVVRCSAARPRRASPPSPARLDRAPDGWPPAPRAAAQPADRGARRRAVLHPRHRSHPLRLGRQRLPADPAGRGPSPGRRADVATLLRTAAALKTPIVFRAGGTSLNGQSQTDSILVDVRHHFQRVRSRPKAPAPGSSPGRRWAWSTATWPVTAVGSAPIRPAPTSPASVAWSPTTRAGCAAEWSLTPTRPSAP